jgi:hypothetical protein
MYTRFKQIVSTIFFIAVFSSSSFSQSSDSAALAAADTTYFSVNLAEGWRLYNSYASATNGSDSAVLDIILRYAGTINLTQPVYVGKIKEPSLKPASIQTIAFSLITSNYILKIDVEGRCYINIISGSQPPGSILVMPVQVTYPLTQ